MVRFFKWFFANPDEPRTLLGVIWWWEARRIPYNLIIGVVGIMSLLLFYELIDLADELEPGEDAIEPMALLLAPVAINFCYTFGWLVELFFRAGWGTSSSGCASILMKLGVSFSLFVVSLPAIIWFVIWTTKSF